MSFEETEFLPKYSNFSRGIFNIPENKASRSILSIPAIKKMARTWHFHNFFHFYQISDYYKIRTNTNFGRPKSKSLYLHLIMWFMLKESFTGSSCINCMQYPWGYAVPVSHILSTRESHPQYPWRAVPVRHILSTCEDMQYPWVISSVPVSHTLSTHEDMQYPWVVSSEPVSHTLSTWSHILSTR